MAKRLQPTRRALSKTTLHNLARFGAPASFVLIVNYVLAVAQPRRELDLLEICCGKGALFKSAKLLGLQAEGMDVTINPQQHNLLSTEGFLHAVKGVLRLRRNSLLWGGLPCSTWVWINRGTSQRSRSNPLGNRSIPSVASANELVSRFSLLVLLAVARGAAWLVEQPSTSLLPLHPRIANVLQLGPELSLFECCKISLLSWASYIVCDNQGATGIMPKASLTRFWMFNYGHFTAKASFVLGDAPYGGALQNTLRKGARSKMVTKGFVCLRYVDRRGQQRTYAVQFRDCQAASKVSHSSPHQHLQECPSVEARRSTPQGDPGLPEQLWQSCGAFALASPFLNATERHHLSVTAVDMCKKPAMPGIAPPGLQGRLHDGPGPALCGAPRVAK